ncbi:hypothetical protein ACFOPN_12645 [Xanthomonas hyacinthi]
MGAACIGIPLAAMLSLSVGCAPMKEVDLDEPVRYVLAGKKYEVPLGYHYVDSLKRRNRWPHPKKEFTEAGAISITGVIPGIRPYGKSTKAEFERLGHGNKISILISPEVTLCSSDDYIRRMNGSNRLTLLPSDLSGLTHYWDNQGSSDESKGDDLCCMVLSI